MDEQVTYIYIAGAHSRARTLKQYLEFANENIKVIAFLVDDMSDNPEIADEIPVKLITNELNTKLKVYIGTKGMNQNKLSEELMEVGFTDIVPLTVDFDRKLRNEYVREFYKNNGIKYCTIDDLNCRAANSKDNLRRCSGVIYVASSEFDKTLKDKYELAPYEKYIQVGTCLTNIRINNAVYDCNGENISNKNRQYCELTGLYWLWKNARNDYIGLAHYRRHFILPYNWCELMEMHNIDVILPVPLYVAPNISENFRERHAHNEWDYMMYYLKKEQPSEYDKVYKFFEGNLYSPCNMLIARKEVLSDLCKWMFPIIDAVVANCGEEDNTYENRYPGFLSERLITYYFCGKGMNYNICYAEKNFLN